MPRSYCKSRFGNALMAKAPLVSMSVVLTLSLTAVAQDVDQGVTLFGGGGNHWFDGNRNLSDHSTYSLGLGYQFSSPLGVELFVQNTETYSDRPGQRDANTDVLNYRLDALYNFSAMGNWVPYTAFGLGEYELSNRLFGQRVSKSRETIANIGGGARYFLTDLLAIRSDLRAIYSFDEKDVDLALNVGLNFMFGGRKGATSSAAKTAEPEQPVVLDTDGDGIPDDRDRCSPTPQGVTVDAQGCALDSDKDGIADYKDQCPESAMGAKVDAKGCYVTLLEDREITLNIQFGNNSDVIAEEYMGDLRDIANFMREYPESDVVIEGHTDDIGAASYNKTLSEKRAKSVVDILVDRFGVDSKHISYVGFGEERPLVDNSTAANRAKNRRVIAVVKAQVKVRQQ